MSQRRPDVPVELERELKVEAGHRCAIPTCRQIPVELAHIDPWSKVQRHEFHNMIALCPTCHTRFDNGQMDRKSMLQYKANLAVLTHRYGELERRVLGHFADNGNVREIELPEGMELLVSYLIRDGLLRHIGSTHGPGPRIGIRSGFMPEPLQRDRYALTPDGQAFVRKWKEAEPF